MRAVAKILLFLSLFSLASHGQKIDQSKLNEIIQDEQTSVEERVLKLRRIIDRSESTDDIFQYLTSEVINWKRTPALEGGLNRFSAEELYPLGKVMLPFDSATPFLVSKMSAHNSSPDMRKVLAEILLAQKRKFGIDATTILKSRLQDGADETATKEIQKLIGNLEKVQVIPPEFRKLLEDQPPSIEEVMLARSKERKLLNESRVERAPKNYSESKRDSRSKQNTLDLDEESQEKITEPKTSSLPWIIAGVLLVGILALLSKIFKGKSTS